MEPSIFANLEQSLKEAIAILKERGVIDAAAPPEPELPPEEL